MRLRFIIIAPHGVDQLLVGKHFPGILDQDAQDIIFRRSQAHVPFTEGDLTMYQVNSELTGVEYRLELRRSRP